MTAIFRIFFFNEKRTSIITTNVTEDNYIKVEIINEKTTNKEFILLDKSTAIKFAKTLRTEINKMEAVNNEQS